MAELSSCSSAFYRKSCLTVALRGKQLVNEHVLGSCRCILFLSKTVQNPFQASLVKAFYDFFLWLVQVFGEVYGYIILYVNSKISLYLLFLFLFKLPD